jgi:DNA-binding transcriptional MocR family regulator
MPREINLLSVHAPRDIELMEEIRLVLAGIDSREHLWHSHGYFPLGISHLRQAIADRLTSRGLQTDADEVRVTNGAQQAISLLGFLFARQAEGVITEDSTLPGAIDVFRTCGAEILTVPVTAEGADVERLAALMRGGLVRLVYLIPTYQCPTGRVMPERARREVARLARDTGIPVIEDDTLAGLQLMEEAPPPIAAWFRDAPVLTIGSMSSSIGPGSVSAGSERHDR